MASLGNLNLAVALLRQLDTRQTQASLSSQASDCAAVVEALGYYDLADYLHRMGLDELPPLP